MKIKTYLSIFVFSLFLISSVYAGTQDVIFNGNFQQGTTLYSNWYNNVQSIYGSNGAYPIRTNCRIETVCTEYKVYYYEKECTKYNSDGKCTQWKRIRNYDIVTRCREIRRCDSYAAICYNPSGIATNQLSLKGNFFYTTDGVNWIQIDYGTKKFSGESIMFKVVIPSICRPDYTINSVIKIEY